MGRRPEERTPVEWRILRHLAAGAATQSELELQAGAARNTVRAALERLERDGLLDFISAGAGPARRGRAKGLYVLAGRDPATPRVPVGTLRPGQLWVRAAGSAAAIDRAYDRLAERGLLARAAWAAELDGDARSLLVVFDPIFGAGPADDLRRALRDVEGLDTTTGTVRDVLAADDLEAKTARLRDLEAASRMGDPGLEPGTSSLSEKRSNRLS